MKKFFIIFFTIIGLLLIAMAVAPVFFKDDIQKALDEQVANNLNARIYYSTDDFSLSLFRSFPNLSVAIGNFGVVGVDKFESDTLLAVKTFDITIDVMSAISGENIVIKNILLDEPLINVHVLEDGSASYDIAKASATTEEEFPEETTTSESTDIAITIEKWAINDGEIDYVDLSSAISVLLDGLNHEGSGDFTLEVFDLTTNTVIEEVSFAYGNEVYLSRKRFEADLTLNMDLAKMAFVFKENRLSLNQFGFGVDGTVNMPGEDIDMDITFEGKDISLKSILSLIPGTYQEYLNGVTASGQIGFDGYVKGTYNENSMPQVTANLSVANGNLKYTEYPIPIEQLNIKAGFDYPTADLKDFTFAVDQFNLLVDGEPASATLMFKDLEDYFWDFKFDGNLDLEKLTNVIPVEGMELAGKINAKMASSGRMSDVEQENYQALSTSGSMSIKDFTYTSPDLPQGFGIAETQASFSSEDITLSSFKGNAGNTDLNLDGKITKYMEYALGEETTLTGVFNFSSALVDINEWITEEDSVVVEEEDTTTLEVVRIPTNVDFELNSSIDKMVYSTYDINNFKGSVVIRDGALRMEGVQFELLEGTFEMSGAYETLPEDPLYDFDLGIKDLSIPKAFQGFETIKTLAPFAEKMTGNFSTDFQISGSLLEDMSPDFNTMQGFGLVNVANAALNEVKLLSTVSGFAGGNSLKDNDGKVSLKDVLLQTEIRDGRVYVKPFEMQLGGYRTAVGGSNSIVGDLDYSMLVKEVSTGAAGSALNSLASNTLGLNNAVSTKVDIDLGVGGTFTDPKVKFQGLKPSGSSGSNSAKDVAAAKAKEELEKAKARAKAEADKRKAEAERIANEKKKEAEAKLKAEQEAAQQKLDTEKDKAAEAAKEEIDKAKDKVKNLFGKKKKKGGGK
ncbi:MAG: AsmA-like C-terminal region-containing protein [Cytophagales bacterium]|nr:AsmA-like C-terminal region-containing protein [Cytophagales bacterium]